MHDLALFYAEPRLYPRGFCVLGLEQLHGLLVCCEILLVLFFQRGEPFACSGEVRRFPLELLVVREGLLIAPTRCLCRKFFGFETAFLFPLGRERGHNVPQLFFLGLNQGRRSQQLLPPCGKFSVTLAARLYLLALIEESLRIGNLRSANSLRAGVRVLLRNPRAELAGEFFRPLLCLLGNVELCLRLAHGLCVDGPVCYRAGLFDGRLVHGRLDRCLVRHRPPGLLLQIRDAPELPVGVCCPVGRHALHAVINAEAEDVSENCHAVRLVGLQKEAVLVLHDKAGRLERQAVHADGVLDDGLRIAVFLRAAVLPALVHILGEIQRRLAALCAGAGHAVQLVAEVKRELDGAAAGIRVVANPAREVALPGLLEKGVQHSVHKQAGLTCAVLAVDGGKGNAVVAEQLVAVVAVVLDLNLHRHKHAGRGLKASFFHCLRDNRTGQFNDALGVLRALFLFGEVLREVLLRAVVAMELVAVHACRDFLRRDFGDIEHATVIEPFLKDSFVESLVCLVRTGVENADDFSLEAVRYNDPLRAQHCADIVLVEADGLELPVGRFDVLTPCLPVVVDVVDVKASRLALVVEVEACNAAAVEHRTACLRELLRPVDVAECYEVKACSFQGVWVDDGLKLCK